jgi:hypothetical protein
MPEVDAPSMPADRSHRKIVRTLVLAATLLLSLTASSALAASSPLCSTAPAGHAQCDLRIVQAHGPGAHAHGAVNPAPSAAPAPGDPGYLQQAYDLTALSATQGHGDTIAIVDAYRDPAAATDLAVYRARYGLPVCSGANGCLKVVNQSGRRSPLPNPNSAWAIETTADLDAVSAICPNCNIDLVEATSDSAADLGTAMQAAAALGATQISDSWSIVSASSPFGSSIAHLLGANAPAVIAATGDAGAVASGENAYPAALPDVTAVGGTTLSPSSSARGVTESAWSGAGYGCDTAEAKLAYQSAQGCGGRSYADISADADPTTGLNVYEAAAGGWVRAGGTSVATPMVAAYEALTGVAGKSNAWAYLDASALNPLSGGYAGQTGTGTISGDVITGAPGVASATATDVSSTSVTLTGGVYSNGASTTATWQYGASTGYGATSPSTTVASGAGASPVSTVISGLAPSTTYHFVLEATNADGTVSGYDASVTTAAA